MRKPPRMPAAAATRQSKSTLIKEAIRLLYSGGGGGSCSQSQSQPPKEAVRLHYNYVAIKEAVRLHNYVAIKVSKASESGAKRPRGPNKLDLGYATVLNLVAPIERGLETAYSRVLTGLGSV